MERVYYVGLDIHKKMIAYCIKLIDGTVIMQGEVAAERKALSKWVSEIPGHWKGAMEATLFTGLVYDFLKPHAVELKVAHPEMLKAITAAKKKNDRHLQTVLIEAAKLAPRWNEQLAAVYEKEASRGNRNRATLAVARKLVAYMLFVEKNRTAFTPQAKAKAA